MIKIQKQQKNEPITVIRAASGNELTNYEKQKLASVEEKAQQNKIEAIKVEGQSISGHRATIDEDTKVAYLKLGDMAFKSEITPDDLDDEKWFFIQCELDESMLENNN